MHKPDPSSPERGEFERLVEEYADRVYNLTLRITGRAEDAEDAMQEAFVDAYRGWSAFRGEAAPTTWLYRIAVNAALRRVRSRHPLEYLSELAEPEEVVDWSVNVVEQVQRDELQHQVLTAIELLEPDLRAALVLRDVDGLSTAEAAEVLEITESALKSRLHRARCILRAQLSDYFRDR